MDGFKEPRKHYNPPRPPEHQHRAEYYLNTLIGSTPEIFDTFLDALKVISVFLELSQSQYWPNQGAELGNRVEPVPQNIAFYRNSDHAHAKYTHFPL